MAIKVSNQITLTEHKKIEEIREWYLATPKNSGVTTNSEEGWTLDIQMMDKTNKYLWNYEETVYSLGSSDITDPVIIGVYGETGSVGASLQVKYISSVSYPTIINNNVSTWSDTVPQHHDGYRIYMTQKLSTESNWSTPIQISGVDGSANIEINQDGYWVINGEITNVKAEGSDGTTPTITIGNNGNWFINGVDSGNKAQGEAGKDGADIDYVYYRNNTGITPNAPQRYSNGTLTTNWQESPQGVSETLQYEYVSVRTKPSGINTTWGSFSTPVIWSKWGEKGQDGDGVEYKYYRSNSSTKPTYSASNTNWKDDPQGVDKDNQYEYVVQIKTTIENGTAITKISAVSLWAKYGEDGKNGVGISKIINYYQVTSDTVVPSTWQDSMDGLELTHEYKYLWNYEEIRYTEGNPTITDPAIIGVYVDAGTSTVDFQIYSVDGFVFSDEINSIELKTAAFYGGNTIESGATYQWQWWNAESTLDDKYENIDGANLSSLVVDKTDAYALTSIRCIMTYNEINYIDYVTLNEKTTTYTSIIKFFDGSNIFDQTKHYLVAYVELYKDNQIEETIKANLYYDGNNIIQNDGIIKTDIDGTFEANNLMYFIYQKENGKYDAILGQYNGSSWSVVDNVSKYLYTNDIYNDVTNNIIVISKEDVSKSRDINISIYQNDIFISRSNATVIDINDPIISDTEPVNVKYGQLWLDTNTNPYTLKIYTKSKETKKNLIYTDVIYQVLNNISSQSGAITYLYSDENGVIVLDDGSVTLDASSSTVNVSYNEWWYANLLKGKYYQQSNSDTVYYMPNDAVINTSTSTSSGSYPITFYYVRPSKTQSVSVELVESGKWEYFSQQNGGAIYTSKPDIYSAGDLWILASGETCGDYNEGTMLKAIVGSNKFDESHWTDSMSDTTTTIKNIKETFEWRNDGLRIKQQATDSNGNITNPFYVHIDSTRMGFHSVTYNDDGTPDDAEVVHVGINSAVIKNSSFVDNDVETDDYSKYENTDGALFDCNANFNKQVSMHGVTTDNISVEFTWKIEPSNGSLSLVIKT